MGMTLNDAAAAGICRVRRDNWKADYILLDIRGGGILGPTVKIYYLSPLGRIGPETVPVIDLRDLAKADDFLPYIGPLHDDDQGPLSSQVYFYEGFGPTIRENGRQIANCQDAETAQRLAGKLNRGQQWRPPASLEGIAGLQPPTPEMVQVFDEILAMSDRHYQELRNELVKRGRAIGTDRGRLLGATNGQDKEENQVCRPKAL